MINLFRSLLDHIRQRLSDMIVSETKSIAKYISMFVQVFMRAKPPNEKS